MRFVTVLAFLIAATVLESGGDAIIRNGLFARAGAARVAVLLVGAAMLFGYGVMLNLAPQPFERVVGLYIATLFVVWQVISFIAFGSLPGPTILVGGGLIVAGGLIVSFWGLPPRV